MQQKGPVCDTGEHCASARRSTHCTFPLIALADTTCCCSDLCDDDSYSSSLSYGASEASVSTCLQGDGTCGTQLDQQLDQQQQTRQACLQPLHVMLQREPSLLAASLVVKSLLKLAALRASREVAVQLRHLFMQQLRAAMTLQNTSATTTAAVGHVSKEARLAIALEQLLPWLSTAVSEACCSCSCCSAPTPAVLQQDVAAAVAAAISSYQAYVQKQQMSSTAYGS